MSHFPCLFVFFSCYINKYIQILQEESCKNSNNNSSFPIITIDSINTQCFSPHRENDFGLSLLPMGWSSSRTNNNTHTHSYAHSHSVTHTKRKVCKVNLISSKLTVQCTKSTLQRKVELLDLSPECLGLCAESTSPRETDEVHNTAPKVPLTSKYSRSEKRARSLKK